MTDNDLRTAVREAVSELLSVRIGADQDEALLAELTPGRYDSLGVLDCVGVIEQRFDVSVDLADDDLRTTFASVAAIASVVGRKLSDQADLGAAL
jgi:acyl carrier protein